MSAVLVEPLTEERRARAEQALAALVENGDLERLVALARTRGSAADALSDEIVSRLAGTAADGLDLLDRVNRSGVARALPAFAALVENGDLDRLVALARALGSAADALSDDIVSRLAGTAADGLDLLDRVNRSGVARALPAFAALAENGDLERLVALARTLGSAAVPARRETMSSESASAALPKARALPAFAALVENGDLDRLVALARALGSAADALSDDIVSRLAGTAADGLDLLDRVNRSGVARALPAFAALVETGDLDRLVALARALGSAADALSDDIVSRLAGTAADGLDLLDRVNRSGVARALPAFAALVENGDLDRLVALARALGSAADALSDDIVSRLAQTVGDALVLVDRATRSGLADRLIALADQIERSRLLSDVLTALEATSRRLEGEPPPRGGVGGLLALLRDPEVQSALRFGAHFLNQFRRQRRTSA